MSLSRYYRERIYEHKTVAVLKIANGVEYFVQVGFGSLVIMMLRRQMNVVVAVSVVRMDVVIFQMVVMPVRVVVQTRMVMIGQEVQSIVRDLKCAV